MEFDDDDYNQPRQTIPASNGHGPYQPTKVNLQNGEHHKYTNVSLRTLIFGNLIKSISRG
jgi:hypothetical protein